MILSSVQAYFPADRLTSVPFGEIPDAAGIYADIAQQDRARSFQVRGCGFKTHYLLHPERGQ